GWVDPVLMRLVDVGLSIPRIFVLLMAVALWERLPVSALVLVIGLTGWFGTSRLVRAEVLSLREREFVAAARALGARPARIILRHVLPNVAAPLIVSAALGIGSVMLLEASLSFLGIVGESGCGTTVTSPSILRLIPEPPGHILSGSLIEFEGRNLLTLRPPELRAIRSNEVAMIFQEPMTSLNPVFTVGDQIAEAAIVHQRLPRKQARARAIEMLRLVGIPDPEERVDHYPHQLSGGMSQRVMIAMALVCHPKPLIADEPTTALG